MSAQHFRSIFGSGLQWHIVALYIQIILSSATSLAQSELEISQALTQLFTKLPACRNLPNIEDMLIGAKQVLDRPNYETLNRAVVWNRSGLVSSFYKVNKTGTSVGNNRYAAVSGLSVGGMLAAIQLAKAGYRVDAFEKRQEYTRRIQWIVRPSVLHQLAAIDEDLAKRFSEKILKFSSKFHSRTLTGENKIYTMNMGHVELDPMLVPYTASQMFGESLIGVVEAKAFEELIFDYLIQLKNVSVHRGSEARIAKSWTGYTTVNGTKPDLVVISEGANSSSAKQLGISYLATSPKRQQIAGILNASVGGNISRAWRYEPSVSGNSEALLGQIINTQQSSDSWVVGDINPNLNPNNQAEVDREFRKLVTTTLGVEQGSMDNVEVSGPVKGQPVSIFNLQQHLTLNATPTKNTILLGDAVGNAHWNAGGGVQVAMVSHLQKLKTLLLDIDMGVSLEQRMTKYRNGVIADTVTWTTSGAADFFPGLEPTFVKQKITEGIAALVSNGRAKALNSILVELEASQQKQCSAVDLRSNSEPPSLVEL